MKTKMIKWVIYVFVFKIINQHIMAEEVDENNFLHHCVSRNGLNGMCRPSKAVCEATLGFDKANADTPCLHPDGWICCASSPQTQGTLDAPFKEEKTRDIFAEMTNDEEICQSDITTRIERCSIIGSIREGQGKGASCRFIIKNYPEAYGIRIEKMELEQNCGSTGSVIIKTAQDDTGFNLCWLNDTIKTGGKVLMKFVQNQPITLSKTGQMHFLVSIKYVCGDSTDYCCHVVPPRVKESGLQTSRNKNIELRSAPAFKDCCGLHKAYSKDPANRYFNFEGLNDVVINGNTVKVFCDVYRTIILLRTPQEKIDWAIKTYKEFENGIGIGSTDGQFIGLKHLYELTKDGSQGLHVKLEQWNSNTEEFHYTSIQLGSSAEKYPLYLSSDNLDDLKGVNGSLDGLIGHNVDENYKPISMKFSTSDSDNDLSEKNCAAESGGAWWHRNCSLVNPFGKIYQKEKYKKKSLHWSTFNSLKSLKSLTFLLEPKDLKKCGYYPETEKPFPRDCCEHRSRGNNKDGIYRIKLDDDDGDFEVLCDMTTEGGGWTIIQQRVQSDNITFNKTYEQYEQGFGKASGSYWIGLENIAELTKNKDQEVRFEMQTFPKPKASIFAFAEYASFSIGGAEERYKLNISTYSGNASNAITKSDRSQNGAFFSSFDQDQDQSSRFHCAKLHGAGWWFNRCQLKKEDYSPVNPNGILAAEYVLHDPRYTYWYTLDQDSSLKTFQIKVRPQHHISKCSF